MPAIHAHHDLSALFCQIGTAHTWCSYDSLHRRAEQVQLDAGPSLLSQSAASVGQATFEGAAWALHTPLTTLLEKTLGCGPKPDIKTILECPTPADVQPPLDHWGLVGTTGLKATNVCATAARRVLGMIGVGALAEAAVFSSGQALTRIACLVGSAASLGCKLVLAAAGATVGAAVGTLATSARLLTLRGPKKPTEFMPPLSDLQSIVQSLTHSGSLRDDLGSRMVASRNIHQANPDAQMPPWQDCLLASCPVASYISIEPKKGEDPQWSGFIRANGADDLGLLALCSRPDLTSRAEDVWTQNNGAQMWAQGIADALGPLSIATLCEEVSVRAGRHHAQVEWSYDFAGPHAAIWSRAWKRKDRPSVMVEARALWHGTELISHHRPEDIDPEDLSAADEQQSASHETDHTSISRPYAHPVGLCTLIEVLHPMPSHGQLAPSLWQVHKVEVLPRAWQQKAQPPQQSALLAS